MLLCCVAAGYLLLFLFGVGEYYDGSHYYNHAQEAGYCRYLAEDHYAEYQRSCRLCSGSQYRYNSGLHVDEGVVEEQVRQKGSYQRVQYEYSYALHRFRRNE